MSYRSRRPRSRTPPRIRSETSSSFRNTSKPFEFKERQPSPPFRSQDLKRSREREDSKRDRWEPRARRTRSRSPRSRENTHRSDTLDKRSVRVDKFEPPFEIKQNANSRKADSYSTSAINSTWRDPERIDSKFGSARFSPNRFQSSEFASKENTFNPPMGNDLWDSNEVTIVENVNQEFGIVGNAPSMFTEKTKITTSSITQSGNASSLIEQPKMSGGDFIDVSKDDDGPAVPEFNPETSKLTSQEWIKLIETKARERDWKPDEQIYVFSSRLAGFARQWYLNTGMKCANWNELKSAFFVAFPSENDYYMLLKKMFIRVKEPRESITQYFHHKVALLNACDIYSRKAVSCIVGGLPNGKMKDDARFQNFDDPDLLYQHLRTYSEDSMNMQKKEDIDDTKPKLSPKKPTSNQVCFACKKKGHFAANCDTRYNREREAERYSELNSKGLIMTNEVMHGSLSQAPTFNKFFTEVAINGISLRGYVDQASKCSTIREESASFLKLPVIKLKSRVVGFSGQSVNTTGFVEVPICIDRAICNIKLHVVPNYIQVIPIVVGQNFINQPHIVVTKDGDKIRFYQRMEGGQTNFDF